MNNKLLALGLLSVSMISACSTTSSTTKLTSEQQQQVQMCKQSVPASKKVKKEAVTWGCLATLAMWKSIGQENPAAMICAAGGGAGFLIGDSIAERKCEYLTLESQLDGEIAHAAKMNRSFGFYLIEQGLSLKLTKAQAEGVLKQYEDGKQDQKALAAAQETLKKQIGKEQELLATIQQERQYKYSTLVKARQDKLEEGNQEKLQIEIVALLDNIKNMQENTQVLTKLSHELASLSQ